MREDEREGEGRGRGREREWGEGGRAEGVEQKGGKTRESLIFNSESYWANKENRLKFFNSVAESEGFNPRQPSNWQTISARFLFTFKVYIYFFFIFIY